MAISLIPSSSDSKVSSDTTYLEQAPEEYQLQKDRIVAELKSDVAQQAQIERATTELELEVNWNEVEYEWFESGEKFMIF